MLSPDALIVARQNGKTTLTSTLLVVVYAYAGDADIRLISAREASRAERSYYANEPR